MDNFIFGLRDGRSTGGPNFLDADVVVGDGENAFLVGQVSESFAALLAHGDSGVEVLVLQLRPVRVDQRHQGHFRLHGRLDAVRRRRRLHRHLDRLGRDLFGVVFVGLLLVRLRLILSRLGLFCFCTFHRRRLFSQSGQGGFCVLRLYLLVFWRRL